MPAKKSDFAATVGSDGGDGYTGHSAQASGIANDNAAFGGNAQAVADSLATQAYYKANPQLTNAQVASNVDGATKVANAYYNPDSTLDKVMQGISLAGSMVGIGLLTAGTGLPALVGGAVGGGTLGAAAGGAAAGSLAGAAGSALTGQNIGKGALLGALGGGISGAASPFAAQISSAAQDAGASSGVGNAIGSQVTGMAGKAITGAIAGAISPQQQAQNQSVPTGTNQASNMATVNPSVNGIGTQVTTADNPSGMSVLGGAAQTGVGLAGSLLATAGSAQAGNTVGNVLSNAQAGTTVGTNTSYNGPNSSATINAGQVNNNLTGGLNLANTALGTAAAGSAGAANAVNGQLPSNVSNAINTQATTNSALPQGTQAQLTGQSNLQGQVQGSEGNLMTAGTAALNNPLTANLQSAAQTQLNTAGQDFNTTYQNSLNSLNAALVQPTQQSEAELANTQFGRGTLGTSGGALQTQAFAQGLGQAYLGNQQTAFNEATNAQNSATTNAATLNNGANSNLSTANSLLADAYGQFNNTSQLNTNTANSIFGQNSTISQLGNTYGQQNVNNQVTAATLPISLTGGNIANSNAAISGATGLNNIANAGSSAALAAGTQQGQQYNSAGQVSSNVLNSSGFAQTGGNSLGAIGAGITSALGSNGVAGGIGNALNGIMGGGGGGSVGSTAGAGSNFLDNSGAMSTDSNPTFDFSSIGGSASDPLYGLGDYDLTGDGL